MTHFKFIVPAVLLAACVTDGTGPEDDSDGLEAARQAVVEANLSAAPDRATADGIEMSTEIGDSAELEQATGFLAEFWQSQADCTTVTSEGTHVVVDFGTLNDDCEFAGRTYAGIDTITVLSVDPIAMAVRHQWNQFTNGNVTLDGTTAVAWIGNEQTRRIVTDYVVANFVDASISEIHGEFVTRRLEPDVPVRDGGFTLDGTRDWTNEAGDWSLDMSDLEIRPEDPAPQAGQIDLTNPAGDTFTIAYQRVDEDTIAATVVGRNGLRHLFHIEADGEILVGGS
jgi:hypothetical protein